MSRKSNLVRIQTPDREIRMSVMLDDEGRERMARLLGTAASVGHITAWSIEVEPPAMDYYQFRDWFTAEGFLDDRAEGTSDWPYPFPRPT